MKIYAIEMYMFHEAEDYVQSFKALKELSTVMSREVYYKHLKELCDLIREEIGTENAIQACLDKHSNQFIIIEYDYPAHKLSTFVEHGQDEDGFYIIVNE